MNSSSPTSGASLLRNGFIAQALILACVAAYFGVVAFLGANDEATYAFTGVGLATVTVMCLWSLVLSIRAVRNGARYRWAAAIWLLAGIELIAPEIYYWTAMTIYQHDSLHFVVSIGAVLPFVLVTALFAGLAVVLLRIFKRWWIAISITLLLYLPIPLFLAPAAVYLLSARCSERWDSKEDARAVIAWTPMPIRDNLDRLLLLSSSGFCFESHRILNMYGQLSEARCVENLSEFGTARETWNAIDTYERSNLVYRIAMDVAKGSIPNSPGIATVNKPMGELIAASGKREDIVALFNPSVPLPAPMKQAILQGLGRREDVIRPIVFHRLNSDFLALRSLVRAMQRRDGVSSAVAEKIAVLEAWQDLKSQLPPPTRPELLRTIVEKCRTESAPDLRRLCATALADVLKLESHHVPFADAVTADGKPVPATLDETEEIESLCNAAEAEAAKSSPEQKP